MSPSITVIIVTHNSAEVITDCLYSIPEHTPIIIVDNASNDNTVATICAVSPHALIIENTINEGFGRANNIALERVETPYALLLNPDARLKGNTLERLLETAESYPDAAIIAPTIVDGKGQWKQSCKTSILEGKVANPLKLSEVEPEGDICTDFLSGAAWLMRMGHFKQIGFFDPAIFMFYEDDDLCIRTKAAGYALILAKDAVVTHFQGQSSPASLYYLWKKNWHIAHSRVYIERKYKGSKAAFGIQYTQWLRYMLKTLIYGLSCNKTKAVRSLARAFGSVGMLG